MSSFDRLIADEQSMASAHMHAHADATNQFGSDTEEHSILEDDSDADDRELDYIDDDDDRSSSLSIPNESIDFDLVYSLHSFAATVEGQASVVKGDSLFLMDDTNSYWWLVRVLKTQDVGYIPAENIETPFERLARLNKHRNVDLAHATPQELQEDVERVRNNLSSRTGSHHSPSPTPGLPAGVHARPGTKAVMFTPALSVHRYPPAVWNEDEEEDEDVEWEDGAYEEEDPELAEEMSIRTRQSQIEDHDPLAMDVLQMEPDDGMSWDDAVAEDMQARNAQKKNQQQQQLLTPESHRSGLLQQRSVSVQQPQQPQALSRQQAQEATITQQPHQPKEQQASQQSLHHQSSWDRLSQEKKSSSSSLIKVTDLIDTTETKKLSASPSIVREEPAKPYPPGVGTIPSNAAPQQQEDDRKRTREEMDALEEAAKKKVRGKDKDKDKASPVSSAAPLSNQPAKLTHHGSGKLRKDREPADEEGKEKRKGRGVFGGLFGRKKDKNKDKASIESISSDVTRESQDSGQSSNQQHASVVENQLSPVTTAAILHQQQSIRTSSVDVRPTPQRQPPASSVGPQTPPGPGQVSHHSSTLRQRDQQQQALYQQYLNRSPSSPPEAPSYGLQSAYAGHSPYSSPSTTAASLGLGLPSSRPRPGSLIISPQGDGQGLGVPELSVIRIFAGKYVQTEATFKTVLLNSSTTSSDLIRQAIQRFRLPTSEVEEAGSYYLTIKQVEGSSTVLLPEEKPLVVFETIVEAVMELPKVKRSSMGSISSVSSNLSMHPAIKQLSMNDFTDDSAVKFYLNKRGVDGKENALAEEDEETIYAESTRDTIEGASTSSSSSGANVTPERFSSPSLRFALQLMICPDDLPDDMVFDPLTEAIVFKNTLKDRATSVLSVSSGVSLSQRRKVFTFPKNVTVAEVIELGLERFGILEGVVDGGDEVEDKLTKGRNSTKVRYWLTSSVSGQERELSPSSKVVDAYSRPPTFRRVQDGSRRRSIDSALLLGSMEDVSPDDPVFILRRAVSYRTSSSRHRMSAPLDEIALQHYRDSVTGSTLIADSVSTEESAHKPRQLSRQEIIAAQRAASREKQRAILSAQTNSVRGVDVLLPGNALIRSSRYDTGDRIRYSYVQDGESYDVSDIIEQELRDTSGPSSPLHKSDLLEGIFGRNRDGASEKLDRVLAKIKDERLGVQYATVRAREDPAENPLSARSTGSSSSVYSVDDAGGRSEGPTPTPVAPTETKRTTSPSLLGDVESRSVTPTLTSTGGTMRARSATPQTQSPLHSQVHSQSHAYQPSIASVMSDATSTSIYATPTAQLMSPIELEGSLNPRGDTLVRSVPPTQSPSPLPSQPRSRSQTPSPHTPSSQARTTQAVKRPYICPNDFGVTEMLAIIEIAGAVVRKPAGPPLHPVEETLFGRSIEVQTLHPEIREIYSGAIQQLDEMDKMLDEYLRQALVV